LRFIGSIPTQDSDRNVGHAVATRTHADVRATGSSNPPACAGRLRALPSAPHALRRSLAAPVSQVTNRWPPSLTREGPPLVTLASFSRRWSVGRTYCFFLPTNALPQKETGQSNVFHLYHASNPQRSQVELSRAPGSRASPGPDRAEAGSDLKIQNSTSARSARRRCFGLIRLKRSSGCTGAPLRRRRRLPADCLARLLPRVLRLSREMAGDANHGDATP